MEKTFPEFISVSEPVDALQSGVERDSSTPLDAAKSESAVLWSECERIGDIYYRLMQAWIESKQAPAVQAKCFAAALIYRTNLDRFIAHPDDPDVRNLRTAADYRILLQRTIEMLSPLRTWLQTPSRLSHRPSNAEIS